MNVIEQSETYSRDNSRKRVLARGCDANLSLSFAKVAPSMLGNAEYIPTTTDDDFIDKLKSQKWSLIYFAPGACRFSAAKQQIPGGNMDTKGWTLAEYRELIEELQGREVKVVETPFENEAIGLLKVALDDAPETI